MVKFLECAVHSKIPKIQFKVLYLLIRRLTSLLGGILEATVPLNQEVPLNLEVPLNRAIIPDC